LGYKGVGKSSVREMTKQGKEKNEVGFFTVGDHETQQDDVLSIDSEAGITNTTRGIENPTRWKKTHNSRIKPSQPKTG